jgi:regulatory protein
VRLLRYRARSEREVRERLCRRAIRAEVQDRLIEELREASLVNDEEFARSWVESRGATGRRGRIGLRWELRMKGVSEEILERALSELMSPEKEAQQAQQVAVQLWRKYGGNAKESWARIGEALSRRGFEPEAIAAAREHLKAAE